MSEAIANGNARYETDDDIASEIDASMNEFIRQLIDGPSPANSFVPSAFPSESPTFYLAGSEIPTAQSEIPKAEDSVGHSAQDSNQGFETPGCAANPIDLTGTSEPIKVLGLTLLNNAIEFDILRELDYWAAAKAAHLWVRGEENAALRATSSYRLIQTLANELRQVTKKLEF